jgi:hypothetical protein
MQLTGEPLQPLSTHCLNAPMPVTKPYRPQQGHPTTEGCVATPRIILYVNIWAVWSWGVLGVFDPPGTGANFLGLIFSNSVVHTFDSIRHGFAYNPGLLSAWVLFLLPCSARQRQAHSRRSRAFDLSWVWRPCDLACGVDFGRKGVRR